MASTFTVRNMPKGALERLRAYARKHNLRTGEALTLFIRQGTEHEDKDKNKPHSIADWRKFVIKSNHTDLSVRVDEILYGGKRMKVAQ